MRSQPARRPLALALLAAALTALATPARPAAAQPGGESPGVTVRLLPQKDAVRPGDQIALAVVMEHEAGFHSWPVAADVVIPPQFTAVLGPGFQPIPTEFEVTERPDGAAVWPVQPPALTTVEVLYTGSPVPLPSCQS